jgi:hypothetical protein
VRSRETSESEPSMKCRKRMDGVKTGGGGHSGTSLGGDLKTGPSGTRLEGGVNLEQALSWNVGTCRRDVKGEDQVGSPHEILSTDAWHRVRTARSSEEGPVMGLERRGCGVQPWQAVNHLTMGGAA